MGQHLLQKILLIELLMGKLRLRLVASKLSKIHI